jgi:hypothetical protein
VTKRRRRVVWLGGTLAGIVATAFGIVLVRLGLDRADQLASVAGVFLALAGLVVAVLGLVRTSRGPGSAPDQLVSGSVVGRDVVQTDRGGAQAVRDSAVGGSVRQTHGVDGDVDAER